MKFPYFLFQLEITFMFSQWLRLAYFFFMTLSASLALVDLNTNSNGLPHVTDSEPTQRWERGESLNTHGLAGVQDEDSGITRLDKLGIIFCRLASTSVNLLLDLSKLQNILEKH